MVKTTSCWVSSRLFRSWKVNRSLQTRKYFRKLTWVFMQTGAWNYASTRYMLVSHSNIKSAFVKWHKHRASIKSYKSHLVWVMMMCDFYMLYRFVVVWTDVRLVFDSASSATCMFRRWWWRIRWVERTLTFYNEYSISVPSRPYKWHITLLNARNYQVNLCWIVCGLWARII